MRCPPPRRSAVEYSFEYNPPAPALKVKIAKPLSDSYVELQGKLDTGADMTVIPESAIDRVGIIPAGRVYVSSFKGEEAVEYTYFVDLSLLGYEFHMVEVIGARRRDALLGRDVLNAVKLTLDGKALNFSISDP
ncbi:MAG: retroviral-like aspartic protease family protein [Candidatus Bathyarchaeia archaeon]